MKNKKPFTVVYEDNHLLILNKAAGVLVQGDKTGDKTLIDYGKDYIANKYNKPGAVFLHPSSSTRSTSEWIGHFCADLQRFRADDGDLSKARYSQGILGYRQAKA